MLYLNLVFKIWFNISYAPFKNCKHFSRFFPLQQSRTSLYQNQTLILHYNYSNLIYYNYQFAKKKLRPVSYSKKNLHCRLQNGSIFA